MKGDLPNRGSTRSGPEVVSTRAALREVLEGWRADRRRIALVPTMGALHPGHLSLVEVAKPKIDSVVMSIFVNPLQFGPDEDLERYPRDLDRDIARAGAAGVELVFAPPPGEVFPEGLPRVHVDPGELGSRLCGRHRPGHFSGVLTIVAKLLGLFRPDVAVFGRKDFQQSVLIRRMVTDLDLPVEIRVGSLVREADGLALSSRNAYLSLEERGEALLLNQALARVSEAFEKGESAPGRLLEPALELLRSRGSLDLQYLEIVEARTLAPASVARPGDVVAVAALVGTTRLIDNMVLGASEPDPRIEEPHFSSAGGGAA